MTQRSEDAGQGELIIVADLRFWDGYRSTSPVGDLAMQTKDFSFAVWLKGQGLFVTFGDRSCRCEVECLPEFKSEFFWRLSPIFFRIETSSLLRINGTI